MRQNVLRDRDISFFILSLFCTPTYTLSEPVFTIPHYGSERLIVILVRCQRSLRIARQISPFVRYSTNIEPHLFKIVKVLMVHGPCGLWKPDASYMKDRK